MSQSEPLAAGLPDEDFSDLTHAGASSLLNLLVPARESPVEALVARMTAPGASGWFLDAIEKGLGMELAAAETLMVVGAADEETLRGIKNRAKKLGSPSRGGDERQRATLVYLLAHAAALVHRNKFLSSCPKKDFEPAFEKLALAAPPPWSELFARARSALDTVPER